MKIEVHGLKEKIEFLQNLLKNNQKEQMKSPKQA